MPKIFEVIHNCSPVIVTRSESKAYTILSKYQGEQESYIVEVELDSFPVKEKIWDNLDEFEKEYLT